MEVKKRLATAGAAAAVVAGIAVVQSGLTGSPWPSSSPVRGGYGSSGLPAPGEADGTRPTAGAVRNPASGTAASRGTARTSPETRTVTTAPSTTKPKPKPDPAKPDQVKPVEPKPVEPKPKAEPGPPKPRSPRAHADAARSGPAD